MFKEISVTAETLKDPRRSRDYAWHEELEFYDTAFAIAELNGMLARDRVIIIGGVLLVLLCCMGALCLI